MTAQSQWLGAVPRIDRRVGSPRRRWPASLAMLFAVTVALPAFGPSSRASGLKPDGNPTPIPKGYTNVTAGAPKLRVTLTPSPALLRLQGNCPWLLPALSAEGFAKADAKNPMGYTGANGWTINFATLKGSFTKQFYYPYAEKAPEFTINGLKSVAEDSAGGGGAVMALTYKAEGTDPSGASAEWIQVVRTNYPFPANAPMKKYGFSAPGGYTYFIDDFYGGNAPSNNGTMNPTYDGGYTLTAGQYKPKGFLANPTTFIDTPDIPLSDGLDAQFQVFLCTDDAAAKKLTIYDGVWWGFHASAVPEPSTWILLASGCAIIFFARRRQLVRRAPSRAAAVTACLAAVTTLAGIPSARAGSVLLTLEMVEERDRNGEGAAVAAALAPEGGPLDRAVASFDRGEFDACLKQLGEAARADAALLPAPIAFARLAVQRGRADLLRPALERAVVEVPDHPEVYLLFGELAMREGRPTDATLHFNRARDLATAARWTGEPRRGYERRRLQGEARVAEARGDWKAARMALEDGLKLDPKDAAARQALGRALFHLGQYDAAYQELERAARVDESHSMDPPAIVMGWLYQQAGDRAKAGEWMDYAVRVAPGSAAARLGRAAWLLDQGRAAEARPDAVEAARLEPGSAGARRLLGLIERASDRLDRAREIYQSLARESPEDAWVCNQLALVLAEQADDVRRREALELAERNVRRDPGSPEALATLGLVYHRLRRLDEADTVLQAVVDSGQASSDALYTLARVRADRGRAGDVPGLLKAALAAPGLFVARDQARQWLERLTAAPKS